MSKNKPPFPRKYTIYRRRKTKVMYFMYLALGGAAFDSKSHPMIRRIYFSLEFYAIIFSSFSSLPCLYNALTADKIDIVYLLSVSGGCCVGPAMLMQTLTTYLCRQNFIEALSLIDNYFYVNWGNSKQERNNDILRKKINIKWWTMVVILNIGSMTVFYTTSRYGAAILEGSKETFHNYHYYITPFAYSDYINSFVGYTIVYFMQVVMLIIFYTKGTTLVVFLFYLGGTFYNPFVKLAHNLTMEFQNISATEMAKHGLRNRKPNFEQSISVRQRCITYLEDYRKLLRATENIRFYVLINYPLNCATVISYFVPSAFSLLQEEQPLFFKLTSGSILISLTLFLFACCYIGKLMDDMNEIMTFAVYNLPWYSFGKEDRKLVRMFLCEVQGTHFQIFALKLFRVSMNAFIRILQFNYSIINLLRRLEQKREV